MILCYPTILPKSLVAPPIFQRFSGDNDERCKPVKSPRIVALLRRREIFELLVSENRQISKAVYNDLTF